MYISIEGNITSQDKATIDCMDRGYLLGDGLFETLRIDASKIYHFDKHWQRLKHSAEILDIQLPFGKKQLQQTIHALLDANQRIDAGIRLTVSRGAGPRGLLASGNESIHWMLHCFALPSAPAKPLILHYSSIRRSESSPLSRLKSLNYLDNILARKEALQHGADDALMLNSCGHIASATCGNFFLYKEDQWLTPPIKDGVLPGVKRAVFIEECHSRGVSVSECSITPEMVTPDCSAFMCNVIRGIISIKLPIAKAAELR